MEKMTCFPRLFSSIVHEHSPKSHYLHKQIGYWIGETNIRFSSASDEFKIRIAIHTIRRNAINFNNILWAPFLSNITMAVQGIIVQCVDCTIAHLKVIGIIIIEK